MNKYSWKEHYSETKSILFNDDQRNLNLKPLHPLIAILMKLKNNMDVVETYQQKKTNKWT